MLLPEPLASAPRLRPHCRGPTYSDFIQRRLHAGNSVDGELALARATRFKQPTSLVPPTILANPADSHASVPGASVSMIRWPHGPMVQLALPGRPARSRCRRSQLSPVRAPSHTRSPLAETIS